MIHVTCFKCRRRFDLDAVWVGIELRKLKARQPRYYQAVCPSCHVANKISVKEIHKDLEAVSAQIEAALESGADQPQGAQPT